MAKLIEKWVCSQCGTQLDIAALGLYAEVRCPRCMRTDIVHAQVGNFRLEGVLGIGGMSVVYRAIDVVLNRPLAIKVLNDTFRDQPERIERFENECAMMARVSHENVTSVYSAGRAYGQFYIAMELVEGTNLEHMVTAERPLEPLYALNIIRSVAQGLEAAHKSGLLHRDMKPGNILITHEGAAKVIDFGLAVDKKEGDTEEIIWATPYYVPPETLQRKQEDVRTDIYALGMTLRYLLSGVESFEAPTSSLSELIEYKRKLPSFGKQNPRMISELNELVDHMTRFSPSDRPKGYPELIEEIDDVIHVFEELSAQAINPMEERSRRSRKVVWAVIGSVAVGLLFSVLLRPSKIVPKYRTLDIESAPSLADDVQALEMALNLIPQNEVDNAVSNLLTISGRTKDATLGAWSAMLAKVIQEASGATPRNDQDKDRLLAQQLLSEHLSKRYAVSPAGQEFSRMLTGIASQPFPTAADWATASNEAGGATGPWQNISRQYLQNSQRNIEDTSKERIISALDWYTLALQAAWLNDSTNKLLYRSKMVAALQNQGAYKNLSTLLSQHLEKLNRDNFLSLSKSPSPSAPSPSIASQLTGAAAALREHNLWDAQQTLQSKMQDKSLSSRTRAQAAALHEICLVAQEVVNMVNRRAPGKYRKGMSARAMADLAYDAATPAISFVSADAYQKESPDGQKCTPQKAIDNDPNTRWCAPDSANGHYFDLGLDGNVPISHVSVTWENSSPQTILAQVETSDSGTAASDAASPDIRTIKKSSETTDIPINGLKLKRLRLTINGVTSNGWASIREIRPVAYAPFLQKETYIIGLFLEGKYAEAKSALDELKSSRPQSYFDSIASSWLSALSSAK